MAPDFSKRPIFLTQHRKRTFSNYKTEVPAKIKQQTVSSSWRDAGQWPAKLWWGVAGIVLALVAIRA